MLCNKAMLEKCRDEILESILYADHNRITIIWDEYDEVLLVTKLIEQYLAIEMKSILDNTWAIIFPNHLVKKIKKHFQLTSQQLIIPHQVISSTDNKFTNFSITIDRVKMDEESLYICTMLDVTETNRLKNKICQLEKEVLAARISANIVHEIRNPITAIKGFLQLIEAGIEHREAYVEVLLSEIEKIEGLTNELLQMANPHKNTKEIVNIKKIIADVLLLMKVQTQMRNIQFDVNCEIDVSLYCNPYEIKQALINLILNGADAMEMNGTIKINVRHFKDTVVIEVIDHGHGISKQLIDKINDEFYTTKEHGTGLGLVVTEQIIENHRGQLSVFSLENIGTTFEIRLPI